MEKRVNDKGFVKEIGGFARISQLSVAVPLLLGRLMWLDVLKRSEFKIQFKRRYYRI